MGLGLGLVQRLRVERRGDGAVEAEGEAAVERLVRHEQDLLHLRCIGVITR